MKVSIWIGLASWLLAANSTHAALLGDGTRGGGAQIEAAFRLRAIELIKAVADNGEASRICPAGAMRAGVEATQILIVEELIDPDTGKPIIGRKLDAWAVPGQLQLLRSAWSIYLDPFQNHASKSVDALVLHEVYRTTGGRCNDDDFRISSQVVNYLNQPGKFAQIFALTGAQKGIQLFNADNERPRYTYCDGQPIMGAVLTCAFLWPRSERNPEFEFRLLRGKVENFENGFFLREQFSLVMPPLASKDASQLLNLLTFATADRPFYIVFDLQFARWAYGYDLSNLINLP